MKHRTLILAAALSLPTHAVVGQPAVKILATIAVEGAFAEIEPFLPAQSGVLLK